MSMKLKPFHKVGNVQHVNNQMKSTTPVLIDLDKDYDVKSERESGLIGNNDVIQSDGVMSNNDRNIKVDNVAVNIVKDILDNVLDTIVDYSIENRLIVVDSDGVAFVERETAISFEEVYKNNTNGCESKDSFFMSEKTSKDNNVASTLVLEEDESPCDVVEVHEIDVDGDLVKMQEIVHGDSHLALDNKSKRKPDNGIQDQVDEIVILSDKESDHRSYQDDDNDKEREEKINMPETVTVLKTPLRIKKNKRLIKSPFSRTNDLLCQKVDKMIRCGKPDIQLLRSLLNHLSENNIGELLAKLVSNDELKTMQTKLEIAKVKAEDNKVEQVIDTDKEINQDKELNGTDDLPRNVHNVCSKLPDGISIDVVCSKDAAPREVTTVKTVNSVDVINTIIRSEVSAAVESSDTPNRSGIPLNIRAESIVELEVTPPPTPEKTDTANGGGLRIANIKNLLAPKDDIIIPEVPIRISNTVSLSKHNEDDDISIIEETFSPVTITRNLPNVSISRSNPPQTHSATQPRNSKSTEARSSVAGPSKPSSYPKPPNSYYDGRGKLRSSLTHKLINLDTPSQNHQSINMPIPMNELIRRYLYPSGSGGVSVGTPMENPWGLPRDLAMYEELLRTNMTSTTDNTQYASYAAAYEELIKSFMSSSPENYAKIVTKYNIFSTDRATHNDHDRPSTSKLTPPRQSQASRLIPSCREQEEGVARSHQAGQTSRLSPHQRTPVIVSAASLKTKGQYKECNIGSGVTLTPVQRSEDLHPQAGPSGLRDQRQSRSVEVAQSRARVGKKRNYKESSEESTSEESSGSDDVPSADEFVMEQAETPRMKAGRSKKKETEMSWKRKKGDRREKTSARRGEGQGGVCGKRRGKVTAMRHNPIRKGQVTVDSTDSEPESRIRKSNVNETSLKTRVTHGRGSSSNESMETSSHAFPRKTNINQAALKKTRVESESSEGWKKSGSSEDSDSSDDH